MTEDKTRYTILVVDDDPFIRRIIKRTFKNTIFTVIDVATAEEAINSIGLKEPDIIILDIQLPGMDGTEFARKMRDQKLDVPILVISGRGDPSTVRNLASQGVVGYVKKPVDLQDLRRRVGGAVAAHRTSKGMPIDLSLKHESEESGPAEIHRSLTDMMETFSDMLGSISGKIENISGEVEIMRVDMTQFKKQLKVLADEMTQLKEEKGRASAHE